MKCPENRLFLPGTRDRNTDQLPTSTRDPPGDRNALKQDCGKGCTILYIYLKLLNRTHFKIGEVFCFVLFCF